MNVTYLSWRITYDTFGSEENKLNLYMKSFIHNLTVGLALTNKCHTCNPFNENFVHWYMSMIRGLTHTTMLPRVPIYEQHEEEQHR